MITHINHFYNSYSFNLCATHFVFNHPPRNLYHYVSTMQYFLHVVSLAFGLVVLGAANSAPDSLSPLPPLWNEAMLLQDLPLAPDGASIIDPWSYKQRLGAMKSLILATTEHSPCLFEDNIGNNILFGLALQFGWQFSSSRLFTTNDTMTSLSWWADMNYQLMILPLLGASAESYPEVPKRFTVKPPPVEHDGIQFCLGGNFTSPACVHMANAVQNWQTFFRSIDVAEKNCTNYGREDALDNLVGVMWDAHTASLSEGMTLVPAALAHFPQEEAAFGVGWANLVDFIASAHFVTNFNNTATQQQLLPMRMLHEGDVPGKIPDMSSLTNRGIKMIEVLSSMNEKSKGKLLALWERAMCSKAGRKEGRELIDKGIRDPAVLVAGILKIIGDVLKPCDK